MPVDSSANLLFTIGANADDAQANIQRFRGLLSKDLGTIKAEFGDWAKNVFGDLSTFEGKLAAGAAAGLAGMVAIAGAAVKVGAELYNAASAAAEYADEIDDCGDKTGMTAEQVSRLRYMGEMTGVEFGKLSGSMAAFNLAVSAAEDPASKQAEIFRRLGISQAEVRAGAQDLYPLLGRVMDGMAGLASTTDKARVAKELFRDRGGELIEYLSLGTKGLREYGDEAERLGLILHEQDIRAAVEFKLQTNALDQALKGLKVTIGTEVLPTVTQLFLGIEAGARTMPQVAKVLADEPWWKWLIPGAREMTALQAGNSIFERELVTAWQRMQRRLAQLQDEQGKGRLGGASGVEKEKVAYAGLTQILDGLRAQMAGLEGPEARAAYEADHLRRQITAAQVEMRKLGKEGKLSGDTLVRELGAAIKAVALLGDIQARQREQAAREQAEGEMAARRDLEDRLEGMEEQTWDHKKAAWIREVDGLRASLAKQFELKDEHIELLVKLEEAGLARIEAERNQAYAQGLVTQQQHLEAMVLGRLTSRERLDFVYQQDLRKFSEAEEAKALKLAKGEEQQAQTQAWYAANRDALLQRYGQELNVLHNSQGWQGVFGEAFGQALRDNEELLREWAESGNQAMMMVRVSAEVLEDTMRRAFRNFAAGMGQNIAQAIVYRKSIGEAMREATAATLASIAAESFTYAIYSTALGFIRLAQHDFPAAGEAFTAAAIFGGVGAVAAVAGRAIAPQQKGAEAPGGAGQGYGGAGEGGAPEAAESRGTRVQIIVQGPIVGASGIEEFLEIVNDAVENRDARLVSTTTRRGGRATQ